MYLSVYVGASHQPGLVGWFRWSGHTGRTKVTGMTMMINDDDFLVCLLLVGGIKKNKKRRFIIHTRSNVIYSSKYLKRSNSNQYTAWKMEMQGSGDSVE